MDNRPRSKFALLVASTVSVLLLSGCGASDAREPDPWLQGYASFDEMIVTAIEEATAGGASDYQLALLEQAKRQGAVSVEQMRDAVSRISDCIELAGGTAEPRDNTVVPGTPWPGYVLRFDESFDADSLESRVDSCEIQEYKWVNTVYQTQPKSREALGKYVLSQESVLRECLESYAITTDPQANGWELAMQSVALDDTDIALTCLAAANIEGL